MNIDEALYTYLSSYAGLTALVSTRIYPIVIPQNCVMPAVSLQKISTSREHAFRQDAALTMAMFQISTWAVTNTTKKGYAHTQAVAYQLRKALQNYSGTMGGSGGVVVNAVIMENEMDDYDSATETFVCHQEFQIWYQEV